jgi:hypothetical protein
MEGEEEGPQMDKDLHAIALFRWSVVPSALLHRDKREARDQTWIERRKEKRQRRGKDREENMVSIAGQQRQLSEQQIRT